MELGGWRKGQRGQCPPQLSRVGICPGLVKAWSPKVKVLTSQSRGALWSPPGPHCYSSKEAMGSPFLGDPLPQADCPTANCPCRSSRGVWPTRSSGTCSGSPTGVWGRCRHPGCPASLTCRAPGGHSPRWAQPLSRARSTQPAPVFPAGKGSLLQPPSVPNRRALLGS